MYIYGTVYWTWTYMGIYGNVLQYMAKYMAQYMAQYGTTYGTIYGTWTYMALRVPRPRFPPMALPCSIRITCHHFSFISLGPFPCFSPLCSYWITLFHQFSLIRNFVSPFFLCLFTVLTCWASQRKSRCSPWTHLLWCRDPKKDISAAVGHTLHQLVLDPKTIWKEMLLVTWLETTKHMLAR